jgi:hypothetical protein
MFSELRFSEVRLQNVHLRSIGVYLSVASIDNERRSSNSYFGVQRWSTMLHRSDLSPLDYVCPLGTRKTVRATEQQSLSLRKRLIECQWLRIPFQEWIHCRWDI